MDIFNNVTIVTLIGSEHFNIDVGYTINVLTKKREYGIVACCQHCTEKTILCWCFDLMTALSMARELCDLGIEQNQEHQCRRQRNPTNDIFLVSDYPN